nr:hypothetical protein [Tanacetum cinerariifolium]
MRVLSKIAYVGHRRFLKKHHKWRRSRDFNGETEDRDPPRKCNRAQILTQLDRLPAREKGKHSSYEGKICFRTLMEADMVKAQSQVIDILCNIELIYPPAFFDIMIQLVIHLPLEALEGGSIPPRQMYPFERYMKKLKIIYEIKLNRKILQRYIDKDPDVSESGELFAFACGPTPSPISINSCVVNGVRFVVHSYDERRTTQNIGICSPGKKDEKCTMVSSNVTPPKSDLQQNVKQVFYLKDMVRRPPDWKVVQDVNHKKFSNGCVIVVEDDHDVIHFDNSYDLALSTSLDDLDFATLNIDGQSMDVNAPPDIIDVDEDDDLIDDEDALHHDLAASDDEDLANDDDDDDDDYEVMAVTMAMMIVPLHIRYPPVTEVRKLENPTGEERKPADSIPTGKPGTSGRSSGSSRCPIFLGTRPDGVDDGGHRNIRASDPDIPRTSPRQIEISRLPFGLILITLPKPFKMLESGQRARPYAGRDFGHLLSSEICRKQAAKKEINMLMKVVRSDDKFSQLLTQLQSQHEVGSGSESGGGRDDESDNDEDVGEDEDAEGDADS